MLGSVIFVGNSYVLKHNLDKRLIVILKTRYRYYILNYSSCEQGIIVWNVKKCHILWKFQLILRAAKLSLSTYEPIIEDHILAGLFDLWSVECKVSRRRQSRKNQRRWKTSSRISYTPLEKKEKKSYGRSENRNWYLLVNRQRCCIVLYCIVLYCIDGVVIAAQCTATFLRSIVLPRI